MDLLARLFDGQPPRFIIMADANGRQRGKDLEKALI